MAMLTSESIHRETGRSGGGKAECRVLERYDRKQSFVPFMQMTATDQLEPLRLAVESDHHQDMLSFELT